MLVCFCFTLTFGLFIFVSVYGRILVEDYFDYYNKVLNDFMRLYLNNTVRVAGVVVSFFFFMTLFFALFKQKLAYVQRITKGVEALRKGNYGTCIELVGNNELTELAQAVNYLSESEQRMKEKEEQLKEDKEELIRTLSHDIRTPLTSIISYTELLSSKDTLTREEQEEYLALVGEKAARIKALSDILLDGGKREVEKFEDARLLFGQLADEFEEVLEDNFQVSVVLPTAHAFSGAFDVEELRRIFDNLISNIQKYAQPGEKVELKILKEEGSLVILQRNLVKKEKYVSESHRMGLNSIRRIVQNYGGTMEVSKEDMMFEIRITLHNF